MSSLRSAGLLPILCLFALIVSCPVHAQSPDLAISKSASHTTIIAGNELVFTLDYANNGASAVSNVVVVDVLSSRLAFDSATGGGTNNNGTVTWDLGTLEPGVAGSVTVTALVELFAEGSTVLNDATINGDNAVEVTSNTVEVVVTGPPEFTLTKSALVNEAEPGDSIVYTVTYDNIGTGGATGAQVKDTLPDHVSFVSANNGGSYLAGVVTWDLGAVAAGASSDLELIVEVDSLAPDGYVLSNSASINSNETTSVDSNTHDINISSKTELKVGNKPSPSPWVPGEELVHSITVENIGGNPATGVTITNAIPQHTSYVSHTGNGDFDETAQVITWTAGTILTGDSLTVEFAVRIDSPLPDGTSINSLANVFSDNAPQVGAGSLIQVSSSPLLSLHKTAEPAEARPGDRITYSFDLVNTGTQNASEVVLVDFVPYGLEVVSISDGGAYNESNNTVTWSVGVLPVSPNPTTVELVTVVTPLIGGLVTNTAIASATGALPASDTATVQLPELPGIPVTGGTWAILLTLVLLLYGIGFIRKDIRRRNSR